MKNAINWFEIPVKDFNRATKFYEALFNGKLEINEAMGMKSGFFPAVLLKGGIGGCIIQGPGYEPSTTGTLVYLNGGDDLSEPLSRVEPAGGKIAMPKTSIGPHGFMAHFTDTEGNKVALHSQH
jgi:predicted enzyme related to lactoylglutathione lyase